MTQDPFDTRSPLGRILPRLTEVLWIWLVVSIPISSFPPVSALLGDTVVSPMSLIPMAGLILVWLIPRLARGGRLPPVAGPLLAFGLIAVIATALSPFYGLDPFRGTAGWREGFQGLGTLAVGVGYFLVFSSYPQDQDGLRRTMRWTLLGMLVLLVWSTAQVAWIRSPEAGIPRPWQNVHRLISVRDASDSRATGLAYEPSWLADQLLMLYLPLLLGLLSQRVSAVGNRRLGLAVEGALLAWGIAILYATYSRIGYLAALAVVAALIAWSAWRRLNRDDGAGLRRRRVRVALGAVGAFGLVVLVLVGLGAAGDKRLALIFRTDYRALLEQKRHPIGFLLSARLAYAERVMYWAGGAGVFEQFPLLGVGLGNAGLLFPQTVPYFGYRLPEILTAIRTGAGGLPNTKSLWIRLLAETGALGFTTFVLFLATIAHVARRATRSPIPETRVLGAAGLLAMLVLVFEGFSLDTFALPQLWAVFGLMVASVEVGRPSGGIAESRAPLDSAAAFRPTG